MNDGECGLIDGKHSIGSISNSQEAVGEVHACGCPMWLKGYCLDESTKQQNVVKRFPQLESMNCGSLAFCVGLFHAVPPEGCQGKQGWMNGDRRQENGGSFMVSLSAGNVLETLFRLSAICLCSWSLEESAPKRERERGRGRDRERERDRERNRERAKP